MFGKKKKEKDNQNTEIQPVTQEEQKPALSPEETAAKKKRASSILLRSVTLAVALGFISLACYSVFSVILKGTNSAKSDNSYICLEGKNVNQTKQIFSKFGKEKQKMIKDYGFIGTNLFVSENHITPNGIKENGFLRDSSSSYDSFGLYDIKNSTTKAGSITFSKNQYSFDFSDYQDGEYLIYPIDSTKTYSNESDYSFYSIDKDEAINITSYSLPDSKGERKKITLRNNTLSPYTLITVRNAGNSLPSSHYDIVLFYQEYYDEEKKTISDEDFAKLTELENSIETETSYKIKTVRTLEEAVEVDATISIALMNTSSSYDSSKVYESIYTNTANETAVLESSSLNGYDSIPEIRECVGYLGEAGRSYYGVIGNDTKQDTDKHLGKRSFLVADQKQDILGVLKDL